MHADAAREHDAEPAPERAVDVPSATASIWHGGLLSPLNLAAYATWLPVALVMLASARRDGLDRGELFGLGCLLGFMALFLTRIAMERAPALHDRWCASLLLAQGALALLATWLLRGGMGAILLVLVAVQLFAALPWRRALGWLAVFNLGLVAIWRFAFGLEWARVPLELLPILGFQAFAGLTAHYATAIERTRDELARVNAQLLATRRLLEESARGEERLKLSRELHDVAGHKLTALKLNLARLHRNGDAPVREEVTIAAQLAHELLDDIRAVVGALRRHDGIDLHGALQTLTARIPGPRFCIDVADDARPGSVAAAETLLRCAQEAITNALRHGHPREIAIVCRRESGGVTLRVLDDGAQAPELTFGNGLTGMRERLQQLGGTLHVAARAPRGVELVARLPAGV